MVETNTHTLADRTEEFLINKEIMSKKYFARWLIIAKDVWRDIFTNTIFAVQSEWKPLQSGTPYNYIDVPQGTERIFSISTTDECGEIQPIFYNNKLNILSKPAVKKCGCQSCDCGGLCDDANSMTMTTKLLFTDAGTDYYEKTWIKVCENGDAIEYREVPTKKYNDYEGDSSPSDYTIVTEKIQKIICKLTVRPCGCPEDTTENIESLISHCGCYLPVNACCNKKKCDRFLGAINDNCKGEVKLSECGTKIYYRPKEGYSLPEFLLVNYQTNGSNCTSAVIVPDYAKNTFFLGMEYYGNRFSSKYSPNEKKQMEYNFVAGQNKLIQFQNPISLEWLSTVQDARIVW